ncbi:MAG: ABC transporter permease subunit [Pseudomonadota bacterium]|nr:ABC transporter permease subunit [Pseudomonadota bacterium]
MIGALTRLEAHSVARARWFYAALALALGLVAFFVAVAARESAVLGFTGFGRVMGGVVQASLLLVPLLALFSTSQSITSARAAGVLEWYLSQPTDRGATFQALFWPRLAAVVVPTLVAVGGLGGAAWALGQPVSPTLLAAFLALLAGQGFCFSALGMWVSAAARTSEQALLRALFLWIAAALLVDFLLLAALLKWELSPGVVFALAGINPVQAGRIGILAVIDPEVGVLGPVGTWATLTLGPIPTIAWGLGWPVLLGLLALVAARWTFTRRDVL